jgi:F-type H+-transporting ATPase subunit epsilon
MPLVVPVSIGAIRIKQDGKWKYAVLSEGFMDISQQQTFVLVDTAEWPDEIDINRAKAAEERARERLQLKLSRLEYIQSQAALQRALSRLELSSKYKK